MKRLYDAQRAEFITILGGKCARCGTTERIEIDHINPKDKSFGIGAYWGKYSLPEALEELKKCQALCHNCHKSKSDEESRVRMLSKYSDGFRHGTFYAWLTKKCQCVICCTARNEFNSNRRKTRGGTRTHNKAVHGSDSMYGYHGCRCEVCKAGHTERHREFVSKRKSKLSAYENGSIGSSQKTVFASSNLAADTNAGLRESE
jgi:hypothetical protein